MKFRTETPDEVFQNPYADKFVTVLDETNEYKQTLIDRFTRFFRTPLNTNLTFQRKRLEGDYGFPTIPTDFPKDVLDALLLNARDINALRGSKEGLKLWLWCLTFGDITIDDSKFYPVVEFIQLSDPQKGFLSKIDPEFPATASDPDLYLFDGDPASFGVTELYITIDTKYYNHASIPSYINQHITKYLSFVTSGAIIDITLNSGVYTTYSFPHQYFVKP